MIHNGWTVLSKMSKRRIDYLNETNTTKNVAVSDTFSQERVYFHRFDSQHLLDRLFDNFFTSSKRFSPIPKHF